METSYTNEYTAFPIQVFPQMLQEDQHKTAEPNLVSPLFEVLASLSGTTENSAY